MSFQVNISINDAAFQKKNVTASTTIAELSPNAMVIWKDNAIAYDVTDSQDGPSTTMQQLNVSPISMLYIYTTDFPCPSGDPRSIIPAQIRLISQFANAASNLFNQAPKPTAPSAQNDSNFEIFSRRTLDSPATMKALTEQTFFNLKNDPRKTIGSMPELVDRFLLNKEMTFKEFEKLFRDYLEEEVYKEEIIKNNPNSAEAKMLLEAKKNKELIDEQYVHAMTHHPEDMIPVTMLYINLTINGVPVKAFIDSGAQKSIMSMACAERCGLNGLIDRRFQAMARGVGGTEKIEGKIHLCDVKVENAHFLCPFEVMARREMDLLVGLNVLRKHACCINLKTQRLEFGNGTSTPFLQSNEIDTHLKAIMALPEEEMDQTQPGASN
uniref:Asp_protease domain-containing protein n=1 Tax=Caenorhabditis japonica TaxID=281687 RepID=A0A8R1I0D4_CAEJA